MEMQSLKADVLQLKPILDKLTSTVCGPLMYFRPSTKITFNTPLNKTLQVSQSASFKGTGGDQVNACSEFWCDNNPKQNLKDPNKKGFQTDGETEGN